MRVAEDAALILVGFVPLCIGLVVAAKLIAVTAATLTGILPVIILLGLIALAFKLMLKALWE